MRLRSGKITIDNEAIQKRGYVRRMANSPNNNGETMTAIYVFEAIPSTASRTSISSSAHSRPILSHARKQGKQVTPPPIGSNAFRSYVTGFTMPLNDREQPYGMLTSMMENLYNVT